MNATDVSQTTDRETDRPYAMVFKLEIGGKLAGQEISDPGSLDTGVTLAAFYVEGNLPS